MYRSGRAVLAVPTSLINRAEYSCGGPPMVVHRPGVVTACRCRIHEYVTVRYQHVSRLGIRIRACGPCSLCANREANTVPQPLPHLTSPRLTKFGNQPTAPCTSHMPAPAPPSPRRSRWLPADTMTPVLIPAPGFPCNGSPGTSRPLFSEARARVHDRRR